MYEKLVNRLRKAARPAIDFPDTLYDEAADAIEELVATVGTAYNELANNEANKPRWIPVTERVPKYGDWVLGIGPKKGYHVCEYLGITHFPYSGDIPWFSAKGRSLTITHWMPLPKPPKENGKSET